MVSKLGHHLNKTVLVSIPPIFTTAEPRHCRLVGIDPAGVWLESEDLSRIAFPNVERLPAKVFVPFTQIAYLVEAPPAAPAPVPSARARNEAPKTGHKPPSARPEKRRR
jgi:hypothetical protein